MVNTVLRVLFAFSLIPCNLLNALSATRSKVLVFGASRSVGIEVFKKLMKRTNTDVIGVVRSQRGAKALKQVGASDSQVKIADITDKEAMKEVFRGEDGCKVIFCVSSQPKRRLFSYVKSAVYRVTARKFKPKPENFYYPEGASPYLIDYMATKNCVDAAVAAKCEHFVLLSCMGGYRQTEMNEIGRSTDDDEKMGNVFKWRRACERHLMKRLFFTIVHFGLLTNDSGGNAEIVWDTDDALLRAGIRKICRVSLVAFLVYYHKMW